MISINNSYINCQVSVIFCVNFGSNIFVFFQRQIEDLLERVHNVQESIINKSTGFSNSMCLSNINPSLMQEVYRACASLESMIASSSPLSPGHATQMESLLQRLRLCDTQLNTSSTVSGKGFKDSQKSDHQSSELKKSITTPSSKVDVQPGSKTLEVEPDRLVKYFYAGTIFFISGLLFVCVYVCVRLLSTDR